MMNTILIFTGGVVSGAVGLFALLYRIGGEQERLRYDANLEIDQRRQIELDDLIWRRHHAPPMTGGICDQHLPSVALYNMGGGTLTQGDGAAK